jgi:hypothetical protein
MACKAVNLAFVVCGVGVEIRQSASQIHGLGSDPKQRAAACENEVLVKHNAVARQ